MKFVAFLDVLGFKALLDNNSIEYIEEIFNDVFTNLDNRELSGETATICNGEYYSSADLSIQMISDSIIIWTKDDNRCSLAVLVDTCCNLLRSCLEKGLPLRGGISVGSLSTINTETSENSRLKVSSVIGDGITKAHDLEKKQKWMGCIIDHACYEHIRADSVHFGDYQRRVLESYNVPIGDDTQPYKALNWANWNSENSVEEIEIMINEKFSAHNKSIDSAKIQLKIRNTVNFFRYVKENDIFVAEEIR